MCEGGGVALAHRRPVTFASTFRERDTCDPVAGGQAPDTCGGGWDPRTQSRRSSSHGCCQIPEHRMRSDCPSGLSLAGGSGSIAAVRLRCRGEGVSLALTGERGRELLTPAVGLRSRRCVVKPDPQRRMASPPGARRKGKGASPRPSPL